MLPRVVLLDLVLLVLLCEVCEGLVFLDLILVVVLCEVMLDVVGEGMSGTDDDECKVIEVTCDSVLVILLCEV